jgi:DtxR family Mn-dependent transcriptional regulator
MIDPVSALLAASALFVVGSLLFWPKMGVLSLLLRALRTGERESIEDALKHLYDCEYLDTLGSIQSLAGALELTTSRVAALITRLESLGLVRTEEAGLRLTTEGRSYALRIIRIHRLWETYLADRTGFQEAEWHFQADRREHRTSAGQIRQMVRETGNPRFDPHGDPIPTEDGEVLSRRGVPLSDLPPGSVVTVVHVEDEPEAIYAQLRAQNIRFNQRLTILDKSSERIHIEVDGEEHAMAPIVAGNVWATPLSTGTARDLVDRLSSLQLGESRKVVGISPACQGLQRRRLLDLGLVPGTVVSAVLNSPAGDPTGYRIRGAVIALRREQAQLVQVQPRMVGKEQQ